MHIPMVINYFVALHTIKFCREFTDHRLSTFLHDIQPPWEEISARLPSAHLEHRKKWHFWVWNRIKFCANKLYFQLLSAKPYSDQEPKFWRYRVQIYINLSLLWHTVPWYSSPWSWNALFRLIMFTVLSVDI